DLLDAGVVEAASVVGDLDEEHVALLLDADDESAFAVLAAPLADLGRLDAVIDRVADQVDERAAEALEDAAVERHFASDHRETRELAGALADVAHRAAERLENGPHRQRGDGLQALFHRGDDVGGFLAVGSEGALHAGELSADLGGL